MDINYEQLPEDKILCVDMKSFFASVEAVDRGWDPLKVCLAVVGDQTRQGAVVLAASSALKKKYNIKTGNRLYEIPRTPEIKIVDARMGLYLRRSLQITLLLKKFVPLNAIHVYSIDESWIKLNGTERSLGSSREAALQIKEKLQTKFGLPSSMGLAPNMFLAKVAMDIEGKKSGLAEWNYQDVKEKLWPVPIKDCWGIGNRLSRWFNRIGVYTVGDIAELPLEFLEKKFGIMGNQLYYHAWGVDLSKLEGHYDDRHKALGRGITLFKDYTDIEEIKTVIFELSEEVAKRARDKNIAGRTIHLGVGYSKAEKGGGFHLQRSRQEYTNFTRDVYQMALELFDENYQGQAVRRISVALGNLAPAESIKLNLFEDKLTEIHLNQTKDELQDKFGYRALFFGKSLRSGSVKERIKTTIGGHGR
ncbi:MAG: UV damage repair protein UvrX [Halanaerobiales bacterium]